MWPPAADWDELEVAVWADVLDAEAYFIHVTSDEDARATVFAESTLKVDAALTV